MAVTTYRLGRSTLRVSEVRQYANRRRHRQHSEYGRHNVRFVGEALARRPIA